MEEVNELLELAMLYDFYGELLNEHQRQIFEDYIFISFGRSDDIGDAEHPHHNGQRIRFVRIDRKKAGL